MHTLTPEQITTMFAGSRVTALDIETTGLKKDADDIIELGMVEFVDGVETRRNSALYGGGSSPPQAVEVHGISDEDRKGLLKFGDVAGNLRTYFAGEIPDDRTRRGIKETIIVGHNLISFDMPFICSVSRRAGSPITARDGYISVADTLLLARKHLSAPDFKLKTLCQTYGIEHGGHRGLGDALSSWNILLIIMETIGVKHVSNLIERFTL
jgi:DNA polymerase III epsilon subunit-like protein